MCPNYNSQYMYRIENTIKTTINKADQSIQECGTSATEATSSFSDQPVGSLHEEDVGYLGQSLDEDEFVHFLTNISLPTPAIQILLPVLLKKS